MASIAILPAPRVRAVMRQIIRARHMYPMAFASHSQSRLIRTDHFRRFDASLDLLFDSHQLRRRAVARCLDCARRDRAGEQVAHRFARPCERQQLILVQVGRDGAHPRPVLHGSRDASWEPGFRPYPTMSAPLHLRPMLCDLQHCRRKIEDLAAAVADHRTLR